MGCTSSAPTSGTVSKGAAKKGTINANIEMWYFEGLCGRADPIA